MLQPGKTFVSYARSDRELVSEITAKLRAAGADLWVDIHDMAEGENWDDAIEHALKQCSRFLVFLSPDSAASRNVRDEIGDALDRGLPVIPVLVRSCDVPLRIKRLQRFDFTSSKSADFPRLVAMLTGTRSSPSAPRPGPEPTPATPPKPATPRGRSVVVKWVVATIAVLVAAFVAVLMYTDYRDRADKIAAANANVNKVSNRSPILCNPLRVDSPEEWGSIGVVLQHAGNSVDVYLNGKCEYSGEARTVSYVVPRGSYVLRVFDKPYKDFTQSIEISASAPSTKVIVKHPQ
jgi:hypothetical protein